VRAMQQAGRDFGGLGSALTYPISRGRRPRSATPQPTMSIFTLSSGWLNGLDGAKFWDWGFSTSTQNTNVGRGTGSISLYLD
jgi:hypothetical protein